jgi:hypothetical protein
MPQRVRVTDAAALPASYTPQQLQPGDYARVIHPPYLDAAEARELAAQLLAWLDEHHQVDPDMMVSLTPSGEERPCERSS